MKYVIKKFISEFLSNPNVVKEATNAIVKARNVHPARSHQPRSREEILDSIIDAVSAQKPFEMESTARTKLNFQTCKLIGTNDRESAIRQIITEAMHRHQHYKKYGYFIGL